MYNNNFPSEKERGKGVPFSRIRRITGYLTGDLSTWGSSKKAEERDRVKHVYSNNDNVDIIKHRQFL